MKLISIALIMFMAACSETNKPLPVAKKDYNDSMFEVIEQRINTAIKIMVVRTYADSARNLVLKSREMTIRALISDRSNPIAARNMLRRAERVNNESIRFNNIADSLNKEIKRKQK